PKNGATYQIKVKGLQGGHSGMDIIKGLGNANKLMNRLLFATKEFMQLAKLEGGSLRNAIPRESLATVVVSSEEKFLLAFDEIRSEITSEYKSLEPNLSIIAELTEENFAKVMTDEAQRNFFNAMNAAHNGVYRMSPDIEDLVETSNNIAKVSVADGNIKIECLTRSSVESSKTNLANALTSVFELAGYEVKLAGDYPGWAPNMDSPILKVLDSLYQKMNGEKANVAACHAGLECGILGQNYPEMDMISFGPTIKGAHSPDERASISSAQKYWDYVLEILKNIPKK
ncbi:MAG TPA: cytosol nonspecific dipeptidase, partial [Aequorivita sp.]|nr:cytosol nonspecific dipeptidase [Aequorivita sp.]